MKKEGYITEQAIVQRKIQIDNVISKLNLVFEFFDNNKRLPESNLSDKYEMRLYNFFRKLDISKYENDLPKEIIDKYNYVKIKNERDKPKRQLEKKIKIKRLYISKCIKAYYDFYLQNGYFPRENYSKEERRISKDYYNIKRFNSYFTKEHIYYINLIDDIKKHGNNINKLLKIKKYVTFCKRYGRFPHHYDGNLEDKTSFDRYESVILDNVTTRFDLDDVCIPYWLIDEVNDAINEVNEKEFITWKKELNNTMLQILKFMEEKNVSADSKKYYSYEIIGFNDKKEKISSALAYIRSNVNYIDDDLIDKYNSFKFVRKPLNKKYYTYKLVGHVNKDGISSIKYIDDKNNSHIRYKRKK